MKNISIIRNRGQLTIPDNIRKTISWVAQMSTVSITVVNPGEIVIKPHQVQIEWDKITADIKKPVLCKVKIVTYQHLLLKTGIITNESCTN